MDAAERDAVLLHESISGLGTKDTALIGIVCTRTPSQLYIIKQAYYNLYHRALEHAVDGDTSGNYQKVKSYYWDLSMSLFFSVVYLATSLVLGCR